MSPDRGGHPGPLFCTVHAPKTAVPIAGQVLLRRVSVQAEVIFTGHGITPAHDQAEAVAQLEQAIEAIGGTLNLHAATSVLGRYEAPPVRQVGPGRPRRA